MRRRVSCSILSSRPEESDLEVIDTTQNPDKSTAALAHLSVLLTWVVGPLSAIAPLIIWMSNKDNPEKQYLAEEAKEALNFQITVAIALVVSMILMMVLIGIFTYFAVLIGAIVLGIMAAVKTNNGEQYRYPVTLRLIK